MEKDFPKEKKGKKKILMGLFILFLLIVGIALVKNSKINTRDLEGKVKGISTLNKEDYLNKAENSDFNFLESGIKNNLQDKLNNIKNQVNNLNVSDLASSSPQLKKVIQDIEELKDLPKNQAKEACYNICKGI